MAQDPQQVSILLVEDDDIDAEMVARGMARARITNPLVRARDGVEALDMLLGTNGQKQLAGPIVMLVDIRMPRMDGLSLVRTMRQNRKLQRTVVFMLTTSDSKSDRAAAYDAQVAGYIIKSDMPDQYLHLANMLEYYLMIVSPPANDDAVERRAMHRLQSAIAAWSSVAMALADLPAWLSGCA